jgi:hypothetical protein
LAGVLRLAAFCFRVRPAFRCRFPFGGASGDPIFHIVQQLGHVSRDRSNPLGSDEAAYILIEEARLRCEGFRPRIGPALSDGLSP